MGCSGGTERSDSEIGRRKKKREERWKRKKKRKGKKKGEESGIGRGERQKPEE